MIFHYTGWGSGDAGSFIKPLSLLGEASYSVYLLHPIVFAIVQIISKRFNISGLYIIAMSIVSTLIISYFVYKYFEKYFIRRGNNLKLILNYNDK
ncbi:hypothetical protein ASD98_03090 [Flavobacterium sp. Root186]|nr:hypothetical protein ASD98_03090 [Flavobacterium sp. Root186]